MTTKDEALKQALEALEFSKSYLDDLADVHGTSEKAKPGSTSWHVDRAIAACREALAQKDEQEPVAWMLECPTMTGDTGWILSWSRIGAGLCNRLQGEEHEKPLYTAPPKRQPLTDECINEIANSMPGGLDGFLKGWGWQQFARAIEKAHGIGVDHDNTR